MTYLRRIIAALMVGTLALGATAGCMSEATAPQVQNEVQQVQQVQNSRTAEQTGLLGGLVGGVVNTLVNLVVRVVNVVGSVGGSLTNGRWRVDLPAGAVEGNATVSVSVANSSSAAVDLGIYPADKNRFATPVRLTADCSNVSSVVLATYVINWYNPATKQWVPVEGSKVDLANKTVSAPLQHFSGYCVGPAGKAGW